MSQERIEAAARAIAEQDRRRPNSFHQAQARDALQAADAHDAANKIVRVTWDDLRAVRDEAWKRGYEACREGKQKHSPHSAAAVKEG